MKYLYLIILSFVYPSGCLLAQIPNSLSIGGGITYPIAKNYNSSWFTSLHWNIGLNRSISVDTHLDLASIGVKDYADAPGVENDHNIYQLGTGLRYSFMKRLFVRAGASAAIVNDSEATIRIFPNAGIGFNIFLKGRHGLEISLNNDLISNFDYHKHVSIFSLGAAYKYRYPSRRN
ncbi:hypothetical protein [Dyadobacter psychrotolerans]|uniref:Outer membrane protein beta-barrel domain-containing protein n=1 Tax=Dyadobacter psychrotolerans TaxID=2541721 RepID=A0A4R5DUS7_9BACT|nr:hypothetical protein [Dyadobacter psychrotolerans]TDE18296.1 hypothetical protein E0F88_01780 [Dyadobacter psychrotolerans]